MSSSVPLVEAAEPLLFSSDAAATAEAAAGSPKYANKSSAFHGTLNFTNCVLGAGIIGTGGAIAKSGYAVSVVTLLFCALLTKLSLDMVIEMGDSRNATFEELGELAFGSRGKAAVGGAKFLYSFGCCVAYIVVIRKNFGNGLSDAFSTPSPLFQDEVFATLVCLLVVLPLSLQRNLDSLSKASGCSVLCVLAISGIVFSEFLKTDPPNATFDEMYLEVRVGGYVSSLGTFVFAFVSQHTCNGVYDSLAVRTVDNWRTVSLWSLVVASSVTIFTGTAAYLTFGQGTSSDLFTVYEPSASVDAAEILLSVTMVFTYPMPFYTCRALLGEWLYGGGGEKQNCDPEDALLKSPGGQTRRELTDKQWTTTTLCLFFVTLGVALASPDLGSVLDIVGCASGASIAFILPATIAIKLDEKMTCKTVLMASVGLFVGIVGTGFAVAKLFE
mmetsp:Transcript_19877/g.39789  ORF Transcript_19877/g.39789 Transcript_19877/m.39789 type:complete len:443 (+) Transcript_19877:170-1498(+)